MIGLICADKIMGDDPVRLARNKRLDQSQTVKNQKLFHHRGTEGAENIIV
jgi:hypothetical protein